MPAVNLNTFDLNLLLAFDAMMQERNVTRAGGRIGLSQPAMSHALNRLRQQLGDELFVRTSAGMVPTPRAEMLAAPLRDALAEVRLALEPADFDPFTADRRFVMAFNNYAAVLIAPPLVAAVQAAAPGIQLDIRPRGQMNLAEHLDRGDLDVVLDASHNPVERFASASVFEDEMVVVMRRDHPAGHQLLSASSFAALQHLDISSPLDDTSFIDPWLAGQGLSRVIVMRAPLHSAPQILAQSDLVANMSRRVAVHLMRSYPLRACKAPYVSPPSRLIMLWHRRLDRHPADSWLRGMIQSVAASL
jgi:DNA-binding transcriptional LysR family regulator